ncbi:hypothetical protein M2T78_14290 [Elizabethkingia ursingii]|uniref:lanthionine synthetase LanC family protein n=1 Tax=Elizabethkingia ursingii TaxID=1756150 RepID=UPI0020139EC2|nr:lanthionine synthetase LanC family protein [Elizabethkingia ursingii]MCL1665434.1 hypothetical protein [Elizabethkingia ursingii]
MVDIIETYNRKVLDFDYSTVGDGLITGKLGLALYFVAVQSYRLDKIYSKRINEILEEVIVNANSQKEDNILLYSSLSKGLTGMVYIIEIMRNEKLLGEECQDLVSAFCEIIYERSIKMFSEENFTFLEGPIGNLFLFTLINDTEKSNHLIDLLYNAGVENEYMFYTNLNDLYTDGINFGMNYGYLSIINSLLPHVTRNKKAKSVVKRCLKVLENNLNYSYTAHGKHIYKPHSLVYDNSELIPYQNNRLCWCNSDLSYSYVLYKVAQVMPELDTWKLAKLIGSATINRMEFENTGIQFAQFCHGTAGLSKLYSQLSKIDSCFKKSEQYWKDRTIEYLYSDKDLPLSNDDLSLLYGKIGALLVIDESIDSSKYLKFLL